MQVDELKERLARALADMENLRERTTRAQEQSRQFAIQVQCSWGFGAICTVRAAWAAWAVRCMHCRRRSADMHWSMQFSTIQRCWPPQPGNNIRRRSSCKFFRRL